MIDIYIIIPARLRLLLCAAATVAISSSIAAADVTSLKERDTTADLMLPSQTETAEATLLSAFFGLDDGLLRVANLICSGAFGQDGMPVIFSTEVDPATMQSGDFQVTTRSGRIGTVHCVSFLPATDAGELRTVLLVGDFGDAESDPPERVDIVGHIHSLDGTLDFQGASLAATPLVEGPTMIMAELITDDMADLDLGLRRTRGTACPDDGVVQAIRVVWAGGVTLENGDEPKEAERDLYSVTLRGSDGELQSVTPVALADLGDGDNNHVLCLATDGDPVSVSFPAGVLTDPNDDLNPATTIGFE